MVSIPKRGFGGFSHIGIVAASYLIYVSIPKRGFGGFSPKNIVGSQVEAVSIPKRGFGGFSLNGGLQLFRRKMFQSLRGVLVGFRPTPLTSPKPTGRFQSLRGVLVGFRLPGTVPQKHPFKSFNP